LGRRVCLHLRQDRTDCVAKLFSRPRSPVGTRVTSRPRTDSLYSASGERDGFQLVEALEGCSRLQRIVVDPGRVETAAFLERELRNRRQELLDVSLRWHEGPKVVSVPTQVA